MRRPIRLAAASVVAAMTAAATVVFAVPAHAATTYTWTGQGIDHTYWYNAQNWSPNGVPTNGDSVSVGSLPGGPSDITAIPTVSLASLTIAETANNIYLDSAAPSTLTVTNSLTWTGGDVSIPLTLAAGATGVINGQSASSHLDHFGGGSGVNATKKLTVAGTLTIVGVGIDQYAPTLDLVGGDDIVVAAGGTLNTTPGTEISSGSCCVNHTASLENFGTINANGPLLFQHMGLDQFGTMHVPTGTTAQFFAGPMRSQGTSAVFSGGGTFELLNTDGDIYDPAHPDAPEYGWKLGTSGTTAHPASVTLRDGTVLQLDSHAYLTGVGSITGTGTFRLSGGHIWAQVAVFVPVQVTATTGTYTGPTSHVDTWSQSIIGEHGVLTLVRAATVAPGASLQIEGSDSVTVSSGGSLTVPGGASITSGGCCVNPARLAVNTGGTLTIGGGTGAALLKWVALGVSGHVALAGPSQWNGLPSVAFSSAATITGHGAVTGKFSTGQATFTPGGAFAVTGTASLVGKLISTSPVTATGAVTLGGSLTSASGTGASVVGSSVSGRFACTYAAGRMPVYTATSMTLKAIGGNDHACLTYATGTQVSGVYGGTKSFPVSLPTNATAALLAITVSGATVATTLTVRAPSGATVVLSVPKTTSMSTYVIIAISTNRTLTATLGAGTARMVIQQAGAYL